MTPVLARSASEWNSGLVVPSRWRLGLVWGCTQLSSRMSRSSLLQLVHVVEDAAGDADREHGEFAGVLFARRAGDRFVLHAAGDVDHEALMDLDRLVVEHHRAGAGDDV